MNDGCVRDVVAYGVYLRYQLRENYLEFSVGVLWDKMRIIESKDIDIMKWDC